MPRIITVSALYDGDPDEIFTQAIDLTEMQKAMQGLARYQGLPDTPISQGDTYTVDIILFGILKTKGHVMHVETLAPDRRLVQSREHNPQVRQWDHTLTVEPHPKGSIWTDRVAIDAGWQTPLTARFAAFVYTRRHRYRQGRDITCTICKSLSQ